VLVILTPLINISSHWRRQLWATGARTPSTSNCLIFQVTSEPHKLAFNSIWLTIQQKNSIAYSVYSKTSAPQLLYSSSQFHNIFVFHPYIIHS